MTLVDNRSLFCLLLPAVFAVGLREVGIGLFHWMQLSVHLLLCTYFSTWSKGNAQQTLRTAFIEIPFRVFCISRFLVILTALYRPDLVWPLLQTTLSYFRNGGDNALLGLLGSIPPCMGNLLTDLPCPAVCVSVGAFLVSTFTLSLQLSPQGFLRTLLFGGANNGFSIFIEVAFLLLLRVLFPSIGPAMIAAVATFFVVGLLQRLVYPNLKLGAPSIFAADIEFLRDEWDHGCMHRVIVSIRRVLWDPLLMQIYFLALVHVATLKNCENISFRDCIQVAQISFPMCYTFPLLWLSIPLATCSIMSTLPESQFTESKKGTTKDNPPVAQKAISEVYAHDERDNRRGSLRRRSISRQENSRKWLPQETSAVAHERQRNVESPSLYDARIPAPSAPEADQVREANLASELLSATTLGTSSPGDVQGPTSHGSQTTGDSAASARRYLFRNSTGYPVLNTHSTSLNDFDPSRRHGGNSFASSASLCFGNGPTTAGSSSVSPGASSVSTPQRSTRRRTSATSGSRESDSTHTNEVRSLEDRMWDQFGIDEEEFVRSQDDIEQRGH
eukprot:gb/GECG01007373.1/.p1 GENE.gb/GECG01007373.1/~~gb/GECG01007373.1/.p1  ORF type:complete len:559 (+),score=48.59 gb/GECG01007373.1/:1-1677(+)